MGERRLALFENIQREIWKTNELQNIGIIEVSPKGSETLGGKYSSLGDGEVLCKISVSIQRHSRYQY